MISGEYESDWTSVFCVFFSHAFGRRFRGHLKGLWRFLLHTDMIAKDVHWLHSANGTKSSGCTWWCCTAILSNPVCTTTQLKLWNMCGKFQQSQSSSLRDRHTKLDHIRSGTKGSVCASTHRGGCQPRLPMRSLHSRPRSHISCREPEIKEQLEQVDLKIDAICFEEHTIWGREDGSCAFGKMKLEDKCLRGKTVLHLMYMPSES